MPVIIIIILAVIMETSAKTYRLVVFKNSCADLIGHSAISSTQQEVLCL